MTWPNKLTMTMYFPKVYFSKLYFSKVYFSKRVFFNNFWWKENLLEPLWSTLQPPKAKEHFCISNPDVYFPNCNFSNCIFPNCIIPNCIVQNCIIPNCIFQSVFLEVFQAYASSKLCGFILTELTQYCDLPWAPDTHHHIGSPQTTSTQTHLNISRTAAEVSLTLAEVVGEVAEVVLSRSW